MNVNMTRIEDESPMWDDINQISIQYVAEIEATGYLVATRRTPAECDVAHSVNFDIVLSDLPGVTNVSFGDRKCFAEVAASDFPLYQFHLAASEEQMQQLTSIVGQRITLTGVSCVVGWEDAEKGIGAIYCRSHEFLDMTGYADAAEHQLSDELADEFSTHCHVVFEPSWELVQPKDSAEDVTLAASSTTKWKMLAVPSYGGPVATKKD